MIIIISTSILIALHSAIANQIPIVVVAIKVIIIIITGTKIFKGTITVKMVMQIIIAGRI